MGLGLRNKLTARRERNKVENGHLGADGYKDAHRAGEITKWDEK